MLTINVGDSNDLDPKFSQEVYTAKVTRGQPATSGSGGGGGGATVVALQVKPEKIRAEDQDSLRAEMEYSIGGGSPAQYDAYFRINPKTGIISQIQPVVDEELKAFNLTIRVSMTLGGAKGHSLDSKDKASLSLEGHGKVRGGQVRHQCPPDIGEGRRHQPTGPGGLGHCGVCGGELSERDQGAGPERSADSVLRD